MTREETVVDGAALGSGLSVLLQMEEKHGLEAEPVRTQIVRDSALSLVNLNSAVRVNLSFILPLLCYVLLT